MANTTTLHPTHPTPASRLLALSLGAWEVSVVRRPAAAVAAADADATFGTGVRWAVAGGFVALVLLVAAASGVGV